MLQPPRTAAGQLLRSHTCGQFSVPRLCIRHGYMSPPPPRTWMFIGPLVIRDRAGDDPNARQRVNG